MNEKTTIGIEVDSSKVEHAIDALDRLSKAAERAAAALERLGGTPVELHRVGDLEVMHIGKQ